ncbi:MAG: hypothetical protein LCI02_21625 [Proteobacteria bacterium]|nr:hypothetical protein [Pseudomonadota bacterium]
MQALLDRIETRATATADHPFIRWLDDPAIATRQRLAGWLPAAAFFVFGFRDLNAEVLPYPAAEAAACPYRRAINRHLAEDATHWGWYLHDLRLLGADDTLPFSAALRRLWSDEHAEQRRAVYRLCMLAGQSSEPALRYALISALEAVAHRLFATVQRVAQQHEDETGFELSYLGQRHLEREPGHLTHQADAEVDLFATLPLDDLQTARAESIAEQVIAIVETRWHEFHRVALASLPAPQRVAA